MHPENNICRYCKKHFHIAKMAADSINTKYVISLPPCDIVFFLVVQANHLQKLRTSLWPLLLRTLNVLCHWLFFVPSPLCSLFSIKAQQHSPNLIFYLPVYYSHYNTPTHWDSVNNCREILQNPFLSSTTVELLVSRQQCNT